VMQLRRIVAGIVGHRGRHLRLHFRT
jgi:hypothetical protein